MSVELLREVRTGRAYAPFLIDGHWDDREVSVLGPFNDWKAPAAKKSAVKKATGG